MKNLKKIIKNEFSLVPKLQVIVLFIFLITCVFAGNNFLIAGHKSATVKLWEPVTFSYSGPSSGTAIEKFNHEFVAEFTHQGYGDKIYTLLFHDGGNTWKLRFTGKKIGTWNYEISDTGLTGAVETGSISVTDPDEGAIGFTTNIGNKWAKEVWENGQIVKKAFIPQYVMYRHVESIHGRTWVIDNDIQDFIIYHHGFNGFHITMAGRWFQYDQPDFYELAPPFSRGGEDNTKDIEPDIISFEILESLISKLHAKGSTLHIWLWGGIDSENDKNGAPKNLVRPFPNDYGENANGVNGEATKRLYRYISARLGPLPGWTMSFGWDLHIWVKNDEQYTDVDTWFNYMNEIKINNYTKPRGWKHMLGARNSHYTSGYTFNNLDFWSTSQHRPDFGEGDPTTRPKNSFSDYKDTMNTHPNKPCFWEDRFRWRDEPSHADKDYNGNLTKRGLWHSAMAGGAANIWGYSMGDLEREGSDFNGFFSKIYPLWPKRQIMTYSDFWKIHFYKNLTQDYNLISNGACLKIDEEYYIFYKEGTTQMSIDLTGLNESKAVYAIDVEMPYNEIHSGTLSPGNHVVSLPYLSDWALVVGSWDDSPTITVVSPNGGESWNLNSTYNVTWNSSGITGDVIIQVIQGGASQGAIYNGANTGSFNWTIDNYLSGTPINTGNYKLQVKSLSDTSIKDQSDAEFSVTDESTPFIEVNEPGTGYNWVAGNSYYIRWNTSSGLSGTNVKIRLMQNGSLVLKIVDDTANDGEYHWTVPTSIASGADYQIRVKTVDNAYYDDGDIFEITNNSTPKTYTIYATHVNNAWRWDWQSRATGSADGQKAIAEYYNDYQGTDPLIANSFGSWTLPSGETITKVELSAKVAWSTNGGSHIKLRDKTHGVDTGWITYTGNSLGWVTLDVTSTETSWTKSKVDAIDISVKRRWFDEPNNADFYVDAFKIVITTQ